MPTPPSPAVAPPAPGRSVRVRVPAKVNLALRVGPRSADGYHRLATVFQAVDLCDYVTVVPAPATSVHGGGPDGPDNLAWRAAEAVADAAGLPEGARGVAITLDKAIPVAGGMAGGSADAAAALVACDQLWDTRLGAATLATLAAGLGSDVPFALRGGTALGLGRGERLSTVFTHGRTHWVVVPAGEGLSTPAVYAELDRRRPDAPEPDAASVAGVVAAVRAGDPHRLATALANDLADAALALRPELAATLADGRAAGALAALVSGSGPTCLFLAGSADHADAVADAMAGRHPGVLVTSGPAAGAAVVQ